MWDVCDPRLSKSFLQSGDEPVECNAPMSVLAAGPRDTGQPRARRDRLVEEHLPLVAALARRYANCGEPIEDLLQVGAIGLIKAADRFDAQRGVDFRAYAIPTVLGEIRRHFRDRASTIRVPRREQQTRGTLRRARQQLGARLEHSPTWAELVESRVIREEELERGLNAERATAPLSLSAPGAEAAIDESGFAAWEDRALVWAGLRTLAGNERRAVSLSYLAGMSQREVAASLGISQSAASRTIARALQKMRSALDDDADAFVRKRTSA
jgi:RNA polymerase sigma-B factor